MPCIAASASAARVASGWPIAPGRTKPSARRSRTAAPSASISASSKIAAICCCTRSLPEAEVADVTAGLLQAAAAAYSDFELEEMPVMADPAAAPALSAMGGRFLRRYCQGIWLRDGQPALYRHVDRFYTRLLDRAERRGAQPTLTATESTRIA